MRGLNQKYSWLKFLAVMIVGIFLLAFPSTSRVMADIQINRDPVILVTGLGGWGRNELLGYKYFGGFHDIEQELRNEGYTVYTVSPSAFGSDWDRACQLYAMIKGGRVDYGKAHSDTYNHEQYGETYLGVYPAWDENHKIQLVGHSMGGQTIRMLVQLLENGYPTEHALPIHSALFDGSKHWVNSVTTIATPNDGSTLAPDILPFAQKFVSTVAGVAGDGASPAYDFGLEQWGLTRQPGESFTDYENRVWSSNVWDTEDISGYDVTPKGAAQINGWVHAQPDVYYFSYSTKKTHTNWLGYQVGDWSMTPLLWPTAGYIGSYTDSVADDSWWPNDGVVNTIAQDGPKLNSTDTLVPYTGTPKRGVWNTMGVLPYDHIQVIGLFDTNMDSFYLNLAQMLSQLPN